MPSDFGYSGIRKRAMMISPLFARTLLAFVCCLNSGLVAHAADINGVWVTDKAVCNKVFVKKGEGVSFASDADLYGSGFIIQGQRIRGKIVTCAIKSTKEEGAIIHLIAACSTDIMLSNMQFSLKIIDDNKVSRIFPGMPELATDYFRCSL